MKKTSKIVLGLSVAVGVLTGVAFANLNSTTAKADDLETTLSTGFIMETGASVRYSTDETVSVLDYSGIRYEMLLNTASYEGIVNEAKASEDKTATFGMLIAPASYHQTANLNEDNVFGKKAVYNWAIWNSETQTYDYTAVEGKTQIVNVSTTIDYSSETHEDLAKIIRKSNGYGYYHYCGSLTKIRQQNLSREFIGVGYVYVNGEYYFAKADDNVRSIAYVAQRAIEDTTTQEELDTTARAWLQQNYVDTVATVDTEYTVEYTIPTNVSGGKRVVKTQTFTGKVGQEITLTEDQLAMAGYDAPESVSAKLYANNKTVIQANYTYNENTKMVVALQGNNKAYVYNNQVIHYISENYSLGSATNGIWINTADKELTVSIAGSSGSAIIVDKNGHIIEGRDGANGRKMTSAYPTREAGATLTGSAFAQNMVVPVGGFVAVALNNTTSTMVQYGDINGNITDTTSNRNAEMRTYMSHYNNCVEITLTGANQVFTEYDGASYYARPGYKGGVENVYYGKEENTKAILTDGVLVINTNGTFDSADDTTVSEVEFSVVKTIDRATQGRQNATLSATVNGESFTLYRSVEVKAAATSFTINFSDETGVVKTIGIATAPSAQFGVNESHVNGISVFTAKAVRLYTKPASYGFETKSNNYGAAIIIEKSTGKVVKSYAHNTYYLADGTSGTITISNDNQATQVYNDYANNFGESYYLLFTPNGNATDDSNDSGANTVRQSLYHYAKNAIGKTVSISCCEL